MSHQTIYCSNGYDCLINCTNSNDCTATNIIITNTSNTNNGGALSLKSKIAIHDTDAAYSHMLIKLWVTPLLARAGFF